MGRLGVGLLALAVITACGESDFRSGQKKENPKPLQPLGGTAPQSAGLRTETHNGAQLEPYQVDIIFLLDTSQSMDSKINQTLANLQGLLANFLDRAQQYDYQVFIVGEVGVPAAGKVAHVPVGVGSHSALAVALKVIRGEARSATLQLRPDSVKELVVVSDDDSDMGAAQFVQEITALKQQVFVNGIVTTGSTCGGVFGIGGGGRGDTYIQLAQSPQTQGAIGDICSGNWSPIFANLGKQLTQFKVSPRARITLNGNVTDPNSLQVQVNGQAVAASNLVYDSASRSVLINHPTQPNDRIQISYR